MRFPGEVKNGVVVLIDGNKLPEGTRVDVVPLADNASGETLGRRLLRYAGTAKGLPRDMARNHEQYRRGRFRK